MGKNIIYTYSCDSCKTNFNSPDEVLSLHGDIRNGEEKVILTDSHTIMMGLFCKQCFIDKILGRNPEDRTMCANNLINIEQEKIDEIFVDNSEYITLRKIETIKDEDEFIKELGHVSRDNFKKLYNLSLIGCYYPIEEPCTFKPDTGLCDVTLIYAAFAGIPQTKIIKAYVLTQFAYAEKSLLGSD